MKVIVRQKRCMRIPLFLATDSGRYGATQLELASAEGFQVVGDAASAAGSPLRCMVSSLRVMRSA